MEQWNIARCILFRCTLFLCILFLAYYFVAYSFLAYSFVAYSFTAYSFVAYSFSSQTCIWRWTQELKEKELHGRHQENEVPFAWYVLRGWQRRKRYYFKNRFFLTSQLKPEPQTRASIQKRLLAQNKTESCLKTLYSWHKFLLLEAPSCNQKNCSYNSRFGWRQMLLLLIGASNHSGYIFLLGLFSTKITPKNIIMRLNATSWSMRTT